MTPCAALRFHPQFPPPATTSVALTRRRSATRGGSSLPDSPGWWVCSLPRVRMRGLAGQPRRTAWLDHHPTCRVFGLFEHGVNELPLTHHPAARLLSLHARKRRDELPRPQQQRSAPQDPSRSARSQRPPSSCRPTEPATTYFRTTANRPRRRSVRPGTTCGTLPAACAPTVRRPGPSRPSRPGRTTDRSSMCQSALTRTRRRSRPTQRLQARLSRE